LTDGACRPLVIAVTPGQAGDSTQLTSLLAELHVDRLAGGPPRTTPTALRADKAYSSKAIRAMLRRRGIIAVIPEPEDQKRNRARRGSRGGRPVTLDKQDYKNRNVVERGFNQIKQWRALATRYDKHALIFRGGVVLRAILVWLTTT
jgi:putative transposase